MAGLDGLRAVAVIAVLLYHGQDLSGIPSILEPQGGFLGVEVFFVISGYLITSLLLREQGHSQTIDLRRFWIRRARRLLPALYTFLVGTTLLAALLAEDALDKIRSEFLGAVFYVSNWLLISTDESYFEAAGRPSLFRHLWSLAIEEQFYLLWPIILLFGLRRFGRRAALVGTFIAVVASTGLMWMLFDRVDQYGDVTSVYYRTDARAAALLVGAGAAFVWRPWAQPHLVDRLTTTMRRVFDVIGLAALGSVVLLQYAFTDRVVEWGSYQQLYHGGFLAVSLTTIVVIAVVVTPGSRLAWLLGNPLFRWIGLRSYGLYLWHWPVYQLTRPRVDVDMDGWTLLLVRGLITVVLVELSYRLIEVPVRQGRFLTPITEGIRTPRGVLVGTLGALTIIFGTVAVALAVPTIDRGGDAEASQVETVDAPNAEPALAVAPVFLPTSTPAPTPVAVITVTSMAEAAPDPLEATPAPTLTLTPVPIDESQADSAGVSPLPPTIGLPPELLLLGEPTPTLAPLPPPPPLSQPFDIAASPIHIFGDSVILGAQARLAGISDRTTVDGRIGRQWWEAEAELRQLRASGLAGDVVVIQLGNNGSMNTQMFDGVMNALAGTRLVLFVNIRAPVVWEGEVNGLLWRSVNRYPDQARVVDWYSASNEHPEYFIEDGTHLSGAGQSAFKRLVESAVVQLS